MHQNRWRLEIRLEIRHRPHYESLQFSPAAQLGLMGLFLKGGEGMGVEERGKEGALK